MAVVSIISLRPTSLPRFPTVSIGPTPMRLLNPPLKPSRRAERKSQVHPSRQTQSIKSAVALRGFEVVLAAGVVGVADAAVAVAVIDAVLAPDLSLAHVNAFIAAR